MYKKEDVLTIPISQVAEKLGISLQKSGKYYKAKCPFHNDKKESFAIYNNEDDSGPGIWKCFTEGIYGDSLELVQRVKNYSFSSAVNWIGRTFDLPHRELTKRERRLMYEKSIAIPVLNKSAEWFHDRLGAKEFKYLTEERGLTQESIKSFKIGYAPKEKYRLKKFLYNEGFNDEALIISGLFGEGESGIYPLFYDRIVIPHRNPHGDVVGFSGRACSEENSAKYLTKNASFLRKGNYAFGLYEARERNTERVFVVEGIFDVIILRQEGETGIAVLGASPNKRHIKLIESYIKPKEIYIALDGDGAGEKGVIRFIKNTYKEDEFKYDMVSDFYVYPTPDKEDIDSLVRKEINKFYNLIEKSTPVVEYIINYYASHRNLKKRGEVGEFVSSSLKIISSISNFSEYGYLELVSQISGVPFKNIEKRYNVYKANQLRYAFEEYEKPLVKYLLRKDNKSSNLEKYLGASLKSILSSKAKRVLKRDFSRYSSKLYYMSIREISEEVNFDEALYYARLVLSTKLYRMIQEYKKLKKENREIINDKTDTKIKDINILYRDNLKKVIRELEWIHKK